MAGLRALDSRGLGGTRRVLVLLYRFCAPHRRTFLLITLLAAASSVADVVAPLIYRTAVNDLAGVFVHEAHQRVSPAYRRTVVVVAHRYSMVEGADRVIVLEGGRVSQAGTVEELKAREGWFNRFALRAAPTIA